MSLTFQSSAARASGYRPDIDGLRGIAIASVLLFHAGISGSAGGFVGVDIFFVISGYLITNILLKDIQRNQFSLISFYDRRIRRIFPALFGVLLFSTLVAAILFIPEDLRTFGKSMVSASLFASNIFFNSAASGAPGYFGNDNQKQVLLHTWSLSVEEQFYLLFPMTLLLVVRLGKKHAGAMLSALCAGSFLLSLWMVRHHPVGAFYIFLPRAWELLIGALLAMKVVPPLTNPVLRQIASIFGLGLMMASVIVISGDMAFPGALALLPCVGAWLCIYAGQSGPCLGASILSFRPLVFLGVISYSLYLWHWPIIAFARYFLAVSSDFTHAQSAAVVLLSMLAAMLSFQFVEQPFRGPDSGFSRRQILVLGLAATLSTFVLGGVFYKSDGLPDRFGAATRKLILENTKRRDDFKDVCSNWKTDVHKMSDVKFCTVGSADSRKTMFWGDSHVQQLYPVIEDIDRDGGLHGEGAIFAIENACMPDRHLNNDGKGFHCDTFASLAMRRAEEDDIDRVFIGFNTRWSYALGRGVCLSDNGKCVRKLSLAEVRQRFLSDLADEIHELEIHGKEVVLCLPFPIYDKNIPQLEIRNAVFGRLGLAAAAQDLTLASLHDELASVARQQGAKVFDPRVSLCPEGNCLTQLGGVSIYKDNNHLAASQVSILGKSLRLVLQ